MKEYKKAQALSYVGNEGASLFIPSHQLKVPCSIPLGFQPLGIASKSLENGGTLLAIAAYFEPAICLVKVVPAEKGGLKFVVNWIRGVDYEGKGVRIFPGYGMADVNRAQTVNFGPEGTLWVTRNADREFFILYPPSDSNGRWKLINRQVLPGEGMLHSALLKGERLMTVESTVDLSNWSWREYENLVLVSEAKVPSWTYGMELLADTGVLLTVMDFRANIALGIYEEFQPLLLGIYGNGLAFLSDGALMVSRYGQSMNENPFLFPGELVYVPADYL